MYTRRDFGKLAAGATALSALPISRVFGANDAVRLGATTWSLRDLVRVPGQDNVIDLIKPLKAAGVAEIDLWSYNVEPAGPNFGPGAPPPPAAYPVKIKTFSPEEIAAANVMVRNLTREYRLQTPDSHFESFRGLFGAAGIKVTAFTVKYDDSFTDEEVDATFREAKALGASSITAPGTPEVMKRLAPFAEKHQMNVAVTDFTVASVLPSKRFRINADIGAITAANGSPMAWIQENHEAIGQLTIKDRRRNKGKNEQFGDGDTPVRDVLRLVKERSTRSRSSPNTNIWVSERRLKNYSAAWISCALLSRSCRLQQLLGPKRSVRVVFVLEVDIRIAAACQEFSHLLRNPLPGVCPVIAFAQSVISKISGKDLRHLQLVRFGQAQRNVALRQPFVNRIG